MQSKLGRWMLGVCVLRVVNSTDVVVKDVRLSYNRAGSTTLRFKEVGDLRPGEVYELKVSEKDISGTKIEYAFAGQVRQRDVSEYFYAGSILEIVIVPGGWVQSKLTH